MSKSQQNKIEAEINSINENTSRTEQLRKFEKIEQQMKEKGIYPTDAGYWRVLVNNMGEEELGKISKSIAEGMKLSGDILGKMNSGVRGLYEFIQRGKL